MKALIMWALESSEAVKNIIKDSYKQSRQEDDLNQPLSVQPWGKDGDKRRFWLIEGQDDTHFRLYRESNPALKSNTWRSIAGTIEEVKEVAENLAEENTQASRRLRERITAAIPRFEASEDVGYLSIYAMNDMLTCSQKRKRRDYRVARKAQFTRADPGFSLYEGRTRGKRIRYTYSDEEGGSDATSPRRSTRQSGISTPAEIAGPTYTASGRQVKSRHGGAYGETTLTGQHESIEHDQSGLDELDGGSDNVLLKGGPRRSAQKNGIKARPRTQRNDYGYDSADERNDESDVTSSGNEWQGGDNEADDNTNDEEDDIDMSDVEGSEEGGLNGMPDKAPQNCLMVTLRYAKGNSLPSKVNTDEEAAKEQQSTITAPSDMQQNTSLHNSSLPNLPLSTESISGMSTQPTSTTPSSSRKQMPEYAFHAPFHTSAPSPVPAESTEPIEESGVSQHQPPEIVVQHSLPTKPLLHYNQSPSDTLS